MKIKRDFITNSSSTSFILMFKNDFDEKKLLTAFGIEENSVLAEIFEDFITSLGLYEKLDLHEYEEKILKEELEKLKDAKKEGKKIYFGKLATDEGLLESFFCQDSFLIDTEEIYFNGRINMY